MPARTIYHVLPHADGWQVKRRGSNRALALHRTKADALAAAKKTALNQAPSQVVIHNADGTIREERVFDTAERDAKRKRASAAKKAAATRKRNQKKAAQARSQAAKKAANTRRKRTGS